MLTAAGCKARRQRLWDQLEQKPDWIVIADPQHLMYFANYFQSPFVFRSTNGSATLLLGADGSSILVADSMLGSFCKRAFVDEVVAPTWYDGQHTAPHREGHLLRNVINRLDTCAGERFGIEMSMAPAGIPAALGRARPGVEIVNVDDAIHRIKRSKDPDEIEVLRRSIKAGDAGQRAALRDVKPGMTELEAYLLIQQAALRDLGDQAQVYGDFVSGPRCEQGGGPPSDRVINAGDLVLVDFSVVVDGYRGDFANTFVCGAAPSAELSRMHEACLNALSAAEAIAKAGVAAKEIDAAVRASFDATHYREYFTSHSGHGLGLGHPDAPYLVPESSDTLVAGDIIAIEPGLYIKGVGGMRFEHNYLVTESGLERLSQHQLEIDQSKAT